MGIDTIRHCFGRGEAIMTGVKKKTRNNYHSDRTLACLSNGNLWPSTAQMRYARLPPMATAFPDIRLPAPTLQDPPPLVDLSCADAASPPAVSRVARHAQVTVPPAPNIAPRLIPI